MRARTLKLQDLFRSEALDRSRIDEEKRTVTLSFSSELPAERFFGKEILSHDAKSVDLGRLNNKAALLREHDRSQQIGVIERAWVDGGKGHATVRFSRSPIGEQEFQDVKDGIRTLVSVGYRINKMELVEEKDGVPTYRASDWTPFEISTVSVPVDPTVGVGRSAPAGEYEITIMPKENQNDPPPVTASSGASIVELDSARKEAATMERKRVAAIWTLAKQHGVTDTEAQRHIEDGLPKESFQDWILQNRYKAQPIPDANPEIGMSRKEIKDWSLVRAIRARANGMPLEGLEREASEAVAKKLKREPLGFFIPHDIACRNLAESKDLNPLQLLQIAQGIRALSAGSNTAGGYTIGTQFLSGSLIEILRNKTMVAQLGATALSGLVGDVAIPRQTGGATAYWLSETASVTASDQTFGQLALVPHRLAAQTAYSKQLLAQASIDIEGFVRNDLMTVLAIKKDLGCLNGTGANGEPLGILNTTGINSVTFGAAATFAKMVSFETEVATDNALMGSLAYLTTAATRGKLKTKEVADTTGIFIWTKDGVNGYRAEVSEQVPSDKVVFGNWSDLIVADWDGMDVVVNPYSLDSTNQVRVTITIMTDNGIRHVESFCVSSDSGAQ